MKSVFFSHRDRTYNVSCNSSSDNYICKGSNAYIACSEWSTNYIDSQCFDPDTYRESCYYSISELQRIATIDLDIEVTHYM